MALVHLLHLRHLQVLPQFLADIDNMNREENNDCSRVSGCGWLMETPRFDLTCRIAIICALLCVGGCSYEFTISVVGQNPLSPIFILKKPNFVMPFGREVPLNSLAVVLEREGVWDYGNPIWEFEFTPGHSKRVREVQYGITPDGFEELKKSDPLIPGAKYLVIGASAGGIGHTVFRIDQEGDSLRLNIIDAEF